MSLRKVFIQHEEFVPEVAKITGTNIIYVEYQFRKAEILGHVCVFEVDISAEQAAEIDRRALEIREQESTDIAIKAQKKQKEESIETAIKVAELDRIARDRRDESARTELFTMPMKAIPKPLPKMPPIPKPIDEEDA